MGGKDQNFFVNGLRSKPMPYKSDHMHGWLCLSTRAPGQDNTDHLSVDTALTLQRLTLSVVLQQKRVYDLV